MKNYRFIDNKGTFYIDNPDQNNYLYFPLVGEQGIKSAITPNLGGDIKLGQNQFILQPVSAEDLHNNKSTRNFWCNIKDQGIWSVTGVSAKEQCKRFMDKQDISYLEAGILWHRVTRKSNEFGLQSQITSFVPISKANIEVMQVKITNISSKPITIIPTAAVPIYGRSADNIRDHRHVTSLLHRITTTDYGVVVTPTLTFDERGHNKNTITYFVSGITGTGEKPVGFYPIVEDYIGEGGSFEWPKAVVKNLEVLPSNQSFEGYEAIGGISFKESVIFPKEEKTYTILIGATSPNDSNYFKKNNVMDLVDEITRDFDSELKVNTYLEQVIKYWEKKSNVTYHTGDSNFDNFMYWVNFQPTLRRLYGCSFLPHHDYGKGGRGWRDLWQDLLALIIMEPDRVREILLNNFAGIRIDGTNATIIGNEPGEFIADRNNITRVWMDHGVWPCITTKLYIDQTGDYSILLNENTYFKDGQILRGTTIDNDLKDNTSNLLLDNSGKPYYGTVLEHLLLQTLTAFYEVGDHNHIRLRDADWNDGLDMASNCGESVAFTAAYAMVLDELSILIQGLMEKHKVDTIEIAKEMAPLLVDDEKVYKNIDKKERLLNNYCHSCLVNISGDKTYIQCDEVIDILNKMANWIRKHIRESEWVKDGDKSGWFNGYYDDKGKKVEGNINGNIRMMLTSQVFTIMSGTATNDQVAKIIDSADKYLFDDKVGGYRLNTNFKEVKLDLGRMFGFAYGHKENGAVFSHMTVMFANALYKRGFVKEGYKAIKALYRQATNFDASRIYPGIPEYFNDQGRGMYHYLTGSASWLMLTVITQMFGIKGKSGDLVLEPKLVKSQFDKEGKASIKLSFHNREFDIIFINRNNKEYGEYQIKSIYLNGMKKVFNKSKVTLPISDIKELDDFKPHELIVILDS